ncbi:MAG: hypothetical protein D6731_05540 [Planctomycetota bacterium]|nr:MAG: hypothetical protein D6731_05540 [Planctomycetota bacterium]
MRCAAALLFVVALAALAGAEEDLDDPWRPARVLHLAGDHGLTGFGSMVDGRLPSPFRTNPELGAEGGLWSARFVVRGRFAQRWRRVRTDGARFAVREAEACLLAGHGVSVRGLDLALTFPWGWERRRWLENGAPDPPAEVDQGPGAIAVAAKVGLRVPRFFFGEWAVAALAPYALLRATTRSGVGGSSAAELGLAVAGPYGYGFRYNGNFALALEEGGVRSLVFRAGGSGVPWASRTLALRAYLFLAGTQHEGTHRPRLDIEGGVQFLLAERVTFDLGASVRVLEDEWIAPRTKRALARGRGARVRSVRDEGSFAFSVGLGVVL